MKQTTQLIPLFLLATLAASHPVAAATKPVKVFILAGQSNMEGAGQVKADPKRNGGRGSLEFLVKDAATAKHFAPLVDAAGQWRTCDDVWISYLDRTGPLNVGFGARAGETIGSELGFGWVMGGALDEPVLLIKCALGGKSLAIDFRPPSAGKLPYSLGEKGDAAIAARTRPSSANTIARRWRSRRARWPTSRNSCRGRVCPQRAVGLGGSGSRRAGTDAPCYPVRVSSIPLPG